MHEQRELLKHTYTYVGKHARTHARTHTSEQFTWFRITVCNTKPGLCEAILQLCG